MVGLTKQLRHREIEAEFLTDARNHANGEQRVAAEFEEVVVQADAVDLQEFPPDAGQGLLDRRARWRERRLGGGRKTCGVGQRLAVELAARGERDALDHGDRGGNHVIGQPFRQMAAQILHAHFPSGMRLHIGDHTHGAARIGAGDDDCGLYRGDDAAA